MASLLWKEARERLLWAVALAMISVHAAATRGYTFYGPPAAEMVTWSMGPIMMAFLMGASAYSSELAPGRAVFLMTRPVTWRGVLCSKLAVSALVVAAAAGLAAVSYRLTCPEAYHDCTTLSVLAAGAYRAVVLTGAGFLVGLGCSSAIAGAAESAALGVVTGAALIYVFGLIGLWSERLWWQMMQVLWPIALLSAALVLARFGLTLSPAERLRRYAMAASAAVVLLAAAVCAIPDSLIAGVVRSRAAWERVSWSISPDGLHALGRNMRGLYWLDIERDKVTEVDGIDSDYSGQRIVYRGVGWLSPHTAYRIGYGRASWFIRTYGWSDGRVARRDIPMGLLNDRDGYPSGITPSPDGRFAAVSLSTGMDRPQAVVFADFRTGSKLRQVVKRSANSTVWWESARTFRVAGPNGEDARMLLQTSAP